jgi:GNAT superfamily N-acetyltransferase
MIVNDLAAELSERGHEVDVLTLPFWSVWDSMIEQMLALRCEIRSLAVSAEAQGLGIGKKLVTACVELAKVENVLEVMAISSNEEFFQSCGFDFTLPGEKKALFLLP